MNKGARYLVYVTEFNKDYNGGFYTYRDYFHSKDAAIKHAKQHAKANGCGEFADASGGGSFWIQAVGADFWVGVQEIWTMD